VRCQRLDASNETARGVTTKNARESANSLTGTTKPGISGRKGAERARKKGGQFFRGGKTDKRGKGFRNHKK